MPITFGVVGLLCCSGRERRREGEGRRRAVGPASEKRDWLLLLNGEGIGPSTREHRLSQALFSLPPHPTPTPHKPSARIKASQHPHPFTLPPLPSHPFTLLPSPPTLLPPYPPTRLPSYPPTLLPSYPPTLSLPPSYPPPTLPLPTSYPPHALLRPPTTLLPSYPPPTLLLPSCPSAMPTNQTHSNRCSTAPLLQPALSSSASLCLPSFQCPCNPSKALNSYFSGYFCIGNCIFPPPLPSSFQCCPLSDAVPPHGGRPFVPAAPFIPVSQPCRIAAHSPSMISPDCLFAGFFDTFSHFALFHLDVLLELTCGAFVLCFHSHNHQCG